MVHKGKKNKNKRSAKEANLDDFDHNPVERSIETEEYVEKSSKKKKGDKLQDTKNEQHFEKPSKKKKQDKITDPENDQQFEKSSKKKKKDKIIDTENEQHFEKSSKKKKKDKNLPTPEGEHFTDGKMSKRQMKKEKHAQRMAESQEASHKAVRLQALSYLSLWKHNKAEWKFNKVKQIYLFKHKFNAEEIPDEIWRDFIEYFATASGGIKNLIMEDSKKIIDEMEQWLEKNAEAENPQGKPSEVAYKRARDLLQNIQE